MPKSITRGSRIISVIRFWTRLVQPVMFFAQIAFFLACAVARISGQSPPLAPPPRAPIRPVTDEYFGTEVVDPYRYMENIKDPEVVAWIKAQSDYTRATMDRLPARKQFLSRIKKLDEAAVSRVFSVKRRPNELYFYQKRLAEEDVPKLYMRRGLEGKETLLVDPSKLAVSGGPHYSINYYEPSDEGSYVAYGVSPGGSEDAVLHVLDTATGHETGEKIERARFGFVTWRPDGHSFFYNRLQRLSPRTPAIELYQKSRVYLHVVGTDAEKDVPVFGYEVSPGVQVGTADISAIITKPGSSYAFGLVLHGVQREITVFVAPLASVGKSDVPWRKICDVADEVTDFDSHGDDIYLLTHKGAPRFKVVHTSLLAPDLAHAQVVVPAGEPVATELTAAQDGLYVQQLEGGVARLLRVAFGGPGRELAPQRIALPFDGSIFLQGADPRLSGVLFSISAWTKAPKILAYDPKTDQITDTKLQPLGPFDDPSDLESVEVKAKAEDGTMIPLSIVYKRGMELDGSHPTLLNGYGAYGITLDPSFDPKRLAWLERGGVLAFAHVRGGGEYGQDWYEAGKKLTKPNTWRDFIACAEYLVSHKYTSPARLGGSGGSAGGITIGRAITERPELLAAAIDLVGVSDGLRTETTSNGVPNIPEFGSVKTEDGFKGLYQMSSYHHVKDSTPYPAVMLTTGINDPRVDAWQAAKMAARLLTATSSGKPVLLRVDYQAGHGIGSTKTQYQELLADQYSFLLWQFGFPEFQPAAP